MKIERWKAVYPRTHNWLWATVKSVKVLFLNWAIQDNREEICSHKSHFPFPNFFL